MSEFKVGDKVYVTGTVRQVSEPEPNALYSTYMVEIDNHAGPTDTIRFSDGELALESLRRAVAIGVGRDRERAAIVAWLGTEACYNTLRSHEWNLADAIERGDHLGGDDE